jgi:ankyrin repeat protein
MGRALVHELEHARRFDWAVQLLARAACALYWFHPLAWIAWRQLRLEAERACDDAVVRHSDATDYAEQLVALARRLTTAPPLSLAMAGRSDLAARVSALLDAGRPRGRAGLPSIAAAAAAAIALVVVVAPVRAVAVSTEAGLDLFELFSGDLPQTLSRSGDRSLYHASRRGDLERMRELIDRGADVNQAIEGDGSPLIGAARAGQLGAVKLLLERGADPNLAVEGDGNPLIMAAREGHREVAALLLDRGAHVNQVVPSDETALIQASGSGRADMVKLLLARGADVNIRVWAERSLGRPEGEWRTALSMARREGHTAVIQLLLAAGARV